MKGIFLTLPLWLLAFVPASQAEGTHSHGAASLPFGLDPAHSHLLTNHIPIFVTLSGLIVLGLSFWWKSREVRRAALLLLLVGIAGGLITYWLGQQAYKPVRGLADEIGQDWLDLHMERAEGVVWLYWLGAVGALTALLMNWRESRFALPAAILAGVLGAATLGTSGWIAEAGGKIRHPEIRGAAHIPNADAAPTALPDSEKEEPAHEH